MDIKRILSALVGIPVVLGILIYGELYFFYALVLFISCFCFYELNSMFEKKGEQIQAPFIYGAALILTSTAAFCPEYQALYIAFTLLFLVFYLFSLKTVKNLEQSFKEVGLYSFSLIFIGLSLSHLLYIRKLEMADGGYYLFFLIVFIWIGDTAAYFTGRNFGKRKLAPMVSPGKTIEGGIGQVVSSLAFTFFCGHYFGLPGNTVTLLALGLILSVVAMYSDIAESLIKRVYGVKDSGNTIPGHGGFLDRVDSFFLTAPLFYYYLVFSKLY